MSVPALSEGQSYTLLLVGGQIVEGVYQGHDGAWLFLHGEQGRLAVSLGQIAVIGLDGHLPAALSAANHQAGRQDTTTAVRSTRRGSATAADIPDAQTLRRVASGILDGLEGPELRAISGLTASTLARVRQAFECARGNLQPEDLPPAARPLVDPIRHALGG